MTKPKRTKIAGVQQLGRRRFKLKATANHPETGKRIAREKIVEGVTVEQAARAQRALRERLINEIEGAAPILGSPTTVADFAELWIEQKTNDLRKGVLDLYIEVLSKRILPLLGEAPMVEITRNHVKEWVAYAESLTKGDGEVFAKDTMMGWWRVLCCFLRDAAAEVGIDDPINRVRPPRSLRKKVTEHRAMSYPQVRAILDDIEVNAPSWHTEVYTMVFSGMRPSELYALTWADVDFNEGVIEIRHSFSRGEVNPTKTDMPRQAAISDKMRALLLAHKERLKTDGPRVRRSTLVFPSSKGTHRTSSALYKVLRRAAARAGVPIKVGPKTLRKTFITRNALDGHDRLAIRSNVGHTDEEMTERYAWVGVDDKRKMVEAFEAATM